MHTHTLTRHGNAVMLCAQVRGLIVKTIMTVQVAVLGGQNKAQSLVLSCVSTYLFYCYVRWVSCAQYQGKCAPHWATVGMSGKRVCMANVCMANVCMANVGMSSRVLSAAHLLRVVGERLSE